MKKYCEEYCERLIITFINEEKNDFVEYRNCFIEITNNKIVIYENRPEPRPELPNLKRGIIYPLFQVRQIEFEMENDISIK